MQTRGYLQRNQADMVEQLNEEDWARLRRNYDHALLDAVREHLESGSSAELDAELLRLSGPFDAGQVNRLLEELTDLGQLSKKQVSVCPVSGCNHLLDNDDIENQLCPSCHTDFRETGEAPLTETRFYLRGPLSRSVPWLITIHGMNTRAPWQEDFSWRVANKFRYHAPVLIFKYGVWQYRVLLERQHQKLVKRLGERIRAAIEHARKNGITEPPDMLVHSFGSLLFSYLLNHSDFKDLKFGRVIVAGGVVKPDFPWSDFINSGRIETVLNHCSKKDGIVKFAEFFIPNSGPFGNFGSLDKKVFNVREKAYGHSSYFISENLEQNLKKGGLWDIFLRFPIPNFPVDWPGYVPSEKWANKHVILRTVTRMIVIFLPAIALIVIMLALF
jgi:hypothetical protein